MNKRQILRRDMVGNSRGERTATAVRHRESGNVEGTGGDFRRHTDGVVDPPRWATDDQLPDDSTAELTADGRRSSSLCSSSTGRIP
jgi:hypothetical protein